VFELAKADTHGSGLGLNGQVPLGPFVLSGQVEYSHTRSDDRNAQGDWFTVQIALRF
jgi:hypothetical protein